MNAKHQYSLMVVAQVQFQTGGEITKVVLRVGHAEKVGKLALRRAHKAARMIMGMVHFEASLDHVDGCDGYRTFGGQDSIYDWSNDGR
jgi:hypothetical protein